MRLFALALAFLILVATPLLAAELGPRTSKSAACFIKKNKTEEQKAAEFGKGFDSAAKKFVDEKAFQKFLSEIYPPTQDVAECICETGKKCTPPCLPDEKAYVVECDCEPCLCRRCCGGSHMPDGAEMLFMQMVQKLERFVPGPARHSD